MAEYLYADLDNLDDAFQPLSKDLEKKRQDEAAKIAIDKTLTDQIENLQAELEEMKKKNINLDTNMNFLLDTAKEELKR